jgi:hypothetical protein
MGVRQNERSLINLPFQKCHLSLAMALIIRDQIPSAERFADSNLQWLECRAK